MEMCLCDENDELRGRTRPTATHPARRATKGRTHRPARRPAPTRPETAAVGPTGRELPCQRGLSGTRTVTPDHLALHREPFDIRHTHATWLGNHREGLPTPGGRSSHGTEDPLPVRTARAVARSDSRVSRRTRRLRRRPELTGLCRVSTSTGPFAKNQQLGTPQPQAGGTPPPTRAGVSVTDESACTPGSVSGRPCGRPGGGHPSRAAVAGSLVRSTRGLGRAALDRPRRAISRWPLLTLLRVGFT